jgi:hypothetical protein
MKRSPFATAAVAVPLAVLAAVTVLGCGRDEPAVARLTVEPQELQLPFPELKTIHFSWEPISSLKVEPTVFVHLIDESGELMRTFDHPYKGRFAPGTPVEYDVHLYQTALAAPLPPGEYRLTVGLYMPGGERWPIETAGEPFKRKEYAVARVHVPPVDQKQTPRLAFTNTWLPLEEGGDRQSPVRRWMQGKNGALRVSPVRSPGSFWLALRIPAGDAPGEKLVLDGSGNPPAVVVTGSCGAVETGISGPGTHLVEIPIENPPGNGQCTIRLRPNYHLLVAGSPFQRTVSMENAAWVPAAAPTKAGSKAATRKATG